jgi:DNA-binding response OmpR family regulator
MTDPDKCCILVAEDDSILRYATTRALSRQGYCVIEARDGKEALQRADEYDGTIHVLVTNVEMPEKNGHELARELKEKRPDLQILIVSGSDEPDFRPEARQFADALMKPVTSEVLLAKVHELLQRHAQVHPISD